MVADQYRPSGKGRLRLNPLIHRSNITADFSADIKPYAQADLSVYVSLLKRDLRLVRFQFLDGTLYGELSLDLAGNFSPTEGFGYDGPTWDGGRGLEIAYRPKLSGGLVKLLNKLGISTDLSSTTIYNPTIELAGSPDIEVTSSDASGGAGCNIKLTATITDDHEFPISYEGDNVDFAVIRGPGTPVDAGSAKASGSASESSASVS